MTPELGQWCKVTSGPQRGKQGCCDLIQDFPTGTRYRITNRDEIVGRFAADQLQHIPNPQTAYESQVSPETYQAALGILTGKGAS